HAAPQGHPCHRRRQRPHGQRQVHSHPMTKQGEEKMTPKVGQPAPQIDAEAYQRGVVNAKRVTSAELAGRWVVLFFYPRDFTFVCPTELAGYAELAGAFDAEAATLVAASTDSYWSHAAWFESHAMLTEVSYPVLADTAHELSRA